MYVDKQLPVVTERLIALDECKVKKLQKAINATQINLNKSADDLITF